MSDQRFYARTSHELACESSDDSRREVAVSSGRSGQRVLVEEAAAYYRVDAFDLGRLGVHVGIDAMTCRWRYSATEKTCGGGCCNVGVFPHQEAVVDGPIGSQYAMNSHYDAGMGAGQAHMLRARAHFPAAL